MLNENIPMYLFHQGTNAKAYEYLGSHRDEEDENFTYFRVWAPHAVAVFVACDRNNWTGEGFELSRINEQGLRDTSRASRNLTPTSISSSRRTAAS